MPAKKSDTAPTTENTAPKIVVRDPNAITFGEITAEESANPFARGSYEIAKDHPLRAALRQTYEHARAASVKLDGDPKHLERLLRRIAAEEGLGVRIRIYAGDRIVFQGAKRKVRAQKATTPATA